jgi:K+-transporting ATPase c subunit
VVNGLHPFRFSVTHTGNDIERSQERQGVLDDQESGTSGSSSCGFSSTTTSGSSNSGNSSQTLLEQQQQQQQQRQQFMKEQQIKPGGVPYNLVTLLYKSPCNLDLIQVCVIIEQM